MKVRDNMNWFLINLNLKIKVLLFIILIIILLVTVMISNFFIDSSSIIVNFHCTNQFPSLQHVFGTDWMGRDMFARTLLGLSVSVKVGLFATVISTILGVFLGLFSGMNRITDELVAIIIDLFSSIPFLLLIILISICLGGGYVGVILGVGLTHWIPLARVLRAEVKKIKTNEFITLSYELGHDKLWVAKNHILPLLMSQIIVGVILVFPHAIMHEASISFLGFGLPPHEPAIGIILSESLHYLTLGYWWLAFFPGLSLLILVLLFDLVGESIQKLLNNNTFN